MQGRVWAPVAAIVLPALAVAGSVAFGEDSNSVTERVDVAGEMLGCPDGSQVQSRFLLDGQSFQVTGRLTALDSSQIIVAGPSGTVTTTPTINVDVGDGVRVNDAVVAQGAVFSNSTYVTGTVRRACGGAGATPAPTVATTPGAEPETQGEDCNDDGESGSSLRVEKKQVQVEHGKVTARGNGVLKLETAAGEVSVKTDEHTKIKGNTDKAHRVKVKGALEPGRTVTADEIEVTCQDDEDDDDGQAAGGQAEHEDRSDDQGDDGGHSGDDGED